MFLLPSVWKLANIVSSSLAFLYPINCDFMANTLGQHLEKLELFEELILFFNFLFYIGI